MKRVLIIGLAVLLLCAIGAFLFLGAHAESLINTTRPVALPGVSAGARALHDASFVVDLHADSLMFGRDLVARSSVGHVDLPRLQDGGVGLQVFTAVTKVPLGFNVDRTDGTRFDLLTLVGLAQLSPRFASGPPARALIQAERLADAVARSGGLLLPVRSVAELDQLVARHSADRRVVGGLLGIEGAHALGDDAANLDVMFAAGYRMIGLAHFFDNAFSGSAHGLEQYGLTEQGRALVQRMQARGVLVDLAHVSARGIEDTLAMASKPVVVSHTGVRATCNNARNLSDEQIRAIAATGGVIGIGYWDTAVCGTEMRYVTAAMRHVIALVGDEHVGLGSDFDGATTPGFDTSALPALTQQLINEGVPEDSIRKILGGNALRVLHAVLPQ
ncbi:MAG: dipeptidase [Candidatus Binatia bacterium]